MLPLYEDMQDNLKILQKKSSHIPPHLHKTLECVYVTEGTLALGVGSELFSMEKGDFAIVFPDLVHHYQVFDTKRSMGRYLFFSPTLSGTYLTDLQQFCPANPVIKSNNVHPDIIYALKSLLNYPAISHEKILHQAFVQIILSRCMPLYQLVDKNSVGSNDMIYQVVAYIASNFKEPLTLGSMAHDLGISPFSLSRIFSGTFHMNFNQYVNQVRLDCVCGLLQYTNQTITEAYENAGFESQRTFNRVFQERYRMSPREYRKMIKASPASEETEEKE